MQNPFLFNSSSEDELNVVLKSEETKASNLQSELLIKTQELEKLKIKEKKLTARNAQSKVKLVKIEGLLNTSTEWLVNVTSKLISESEIKLEIIKKKLNRNNTMLLSLRSSLDEKQLKVQSVHELTGMREKKLSTELEMLKLKERKSTTLYTQSKVKLDKVERRLYSGIEWLANVPSKLISKSEIKLKIIEKKLSRSVTMLLSLQSNLMEKQLIYQEVQSVHELKGMKRKKLSFEAKLSDETMASSQPNFNSLNLPKVENLRGKEILAASKKDVNDNQYGNIHMYVCTYVSVT